MKEEYRNKVIGIPVTEKEKEEIKKHAERQGLSLAQFFRSLWIQFKEEKKM